jgi:DNA-binding transcriptional LysR family regulator
MDEHLLSRKIDLCISLDSSEQLHIHKEPLLTESVCFLISSRLFAKYFGENTEMKYKQFQNGIDFSEILEIPLILQPTTNFIRKVINQHFESLDVVPRALFETNDSEMIYKMCLADCGAALLSESVIYASSRAEHQDLKDIYAFPLRNVELSSVISYPSDIALPHYKQVFVDVCKQVFMESHYEMMRQKHTYW